MVLASIITLVFLLISHLASAKILLTGSNTTLSFDDAEANFTPKIKESGQCGVLYLAEPSHACSGLANAVTVKNGSVTPYLLVIRGGCLFETKVRNAQKAGYKAAIVYDNVERGALVSMSGKPYGVHIYGTFVSKQTGEILKEYVGCTDMELWLLPSLETSVWSIVAVSLVAVLAIFAVLATCFFVRRRRVRRRRRSSPMDKGILERMPVTLFNGTCEEKTTSVKCVICLEKYRFEEKIKTLPCHHKFHAKCADEWLGQHKPLCPICRHDARTIRITFPATENTPLLSTA